jgi:hypothetical protein
MPKGSPILHRWSDDTVVRNGNCEDRVMRGAYREALMSAGAMTILLLALFAGDARIRDQFSQRFVARPSLELASVDRQVRDVTTAIAHAASAQSRAHAPLLIFSVAAAVLVLFMLRT